MKKLTTPQPSHITTGDVFDDLGFAPSTALELKIKSDLWMAIREEIERGGHSQRQLCQMLDEYQPEVSNLLNGRISRMSLEKLLRYAGRLGMKATLRVAPPKKSSRRAA